MYKLFYGLAEQPFNLTPDSRFLYLSRRHQEALSALLYGVTERKGFICLTGEIGSGKTTLLRALLAKLDRAKTPTAIILNSYLTDLELLKTINEEFGLSGESDSKKALLDELNAFLVEQYQLGHNCILILDESQNLKPETLEQIRMISNLETETDKLIQIVLVGQPELRQTLGLPELEQLNQRITVRYHVMPLNEDEIAEYIYHRLRVAQIQVQVEFTPQALRLLFHYTRGVPRRLNVICDRCLLSGYVLGRYDIDGKMVEAVVKEIRGETEFEVTAPFKAMAPLLGGRIPRVPVGRALTTAGALAVVVFLGVWIGSVVRGGGFSPAGSLISEAEASSQTRVLETPEAVIPGAAVEAGFGQVHATFLPEDAAEPQTYEPGPFAWASLESPDYRASGIALRENDFSESPAGANADSSSELGDLDTAGRGRVVAEPVGAVAGDFPDDIVQEIDERLASEREPARTSPWTYDSDGVLRVERNDHCTAAAYISVLGVWGIEVDLEPFAQAPAEMIPRYDMPAMIGQLDFAVFSTDSLAEALALDLPVIVSIESADGSIREVGLIRVEGESATLADPIVGLRVEPISLVENWARGFSVPYRDPTGMTGLAPGEIGPSVIALQRALMGFGYLKSRIDGVYGPQVGEALRGYQTDRGIEATGAVDPATAALVCAQVDADRPRLRP